MNFFASISSFLTLIGDFIVNLVSGLIQALSLTSGVLVIPTVFAGYVPAIVSSSILIFITIGVLKFIIGR